MQESYAESACAAKLLGLAELAKELRCTVSVSYETDKEWTLHCGRTLDGQSGQTVQHVADAHPRIHLEFSLDLKRAALHARLSHRGNSLAVIHQRQ